MARKKSLEPGQLVWIRVKKYLHLTSTTTFVRIVGGRSTGYFKIITGAPVAGTYLRKALAKDFSSGERKFILSSGRSLAKSISERSSVILTAHGLLIANNDLIVTRLRKTK